MTIYIPTGELIGLITDVAGFACPDPEFPRVHAVRLDWDGNQLHACATDDIHAGVSTWDPDDLPEGAGTQEGLFARTSDADRPWHIVLTLTDALDITKKFKVKTADLWVPLGLDYQAGMTAEHRLRISRHTDTGHPGLTFTVLDQDVDFPNIRIGLDRTPAPRPVGEIEFNPIMLSHFGAVRMRGEAMRMVFTGPDMVIVHIGERFIGGIRPARPARHLTSVA